MMPSSATVGKRQVQTEYPQGVIFDLDGTLVDNEALHLSLIQETARTIGYRLTAEEYYSTLMGLTDEEVFAHVLKCSRRIRPVSELVSLKQGKYLSRLTAGDVEPTAGVIPFIESLLARGARVAVATNASRLETALTLRSVGLTDLIQTTVTVESVSRGKPAPDLYLRAARLIGISPRQCLAYEDSVHGIQAAVAAGMWVVGVGRSDGHRLRAAGAMMVVEDFVRHELSANAVFSDELACAV